ncbi:hypothetical protein TRIUR3_28862 [Triticum urartu]|uniref:Uncharacterized protein n=1 Tax=Triticum urartu TaxID=4572 RepID=M8ARI5_TRIUA|nr:hypothetical protein TRIUR3_28862 [Triticum urartu]
MVTSTPSTTTHKTENAKNPFELSRPQDHADDYRTGMSSTSAEDSHRRHVYDYYINEYRTNHQDLRERLRGPTSTMTSVDRQVPLRIRKFLEGPPRPSTTTGPERSTTMTIDMYHYTAPKRQDRPGYCQVPLRFRNATSTTTTLEDLGSIKFDYHVCTTTAAVSFDKTSCASISTTVPVITDE